MNGLDYFTFVVLAVLIGAGLYLAFILGALPGKIAAERGHPQADAIRVAGWFGLLMLGLLWPLALIWAYTTPATGQGQLPPSGSLLAWTDQPTPGRFGVRLQLDTSSDDLTIPAGAAGVAAVYTDRATAIRIIRKVVIRMTTWLNYVIL